MVPGEITMRECVAVGTALRGQISIRQRESKRFCPTDRDLTPNIPNILTANTGLPSTMSPEYGCSQDTASR
jgi:hypothetical protein